MPQLDRKIEGETEILLRQEANVPSIVIEQRFGDRDVLFEYEYGVVDSRRVCVLKTHPKTHHNRISFFVLFVSFVVDILFGFSYFVTS